MSSAARAKRRRQRGVLIEAFGARRWRLPPSSGVSKRAARAAAADGRAGVEIISARRSTSAARSVLRSPSWARRSCARRRGCAPAPCRRREHAKAGRFARTAPVWSAPTVNRARFSSAAIMTVQRINFVAVSTVGRNTPGDAFDSRSRREVASAIAGSMQFVRTQTQGPANLRRVGVHA